MNDTLQLDTALIARWQQDPQYDYGRDFSTGDQNVLAWLMEQIGRGMSRTINDIFGHDVATYVYVAVGVAVVVLLAWLLWRRHGSIFARREEAEMSYEVVEETIYGIDFDAEIRSAMQREDYRSAVRLIYLQTLRHLSDEGRIDWQPSRTAMQYVRQMKDSRFSEFSNHFVRVRYGNFEADKQMALRMQELQAQMKGGADA